MEEELPEPALVGNRGQRRHSSWRTWIWYVVRVGGGGKVAGSWAVLLGGGEVGGSVDPDAATTFPYTLYKINFQNNLVINF